MFPSACQARIRARHEVIAAAATMTIAGRNREMTVVPEPVSKKGISFW
jgi:hypothetical protein